MSEKIRLLTKIKRFICVLSDKWYMGTTCAHSGLPIYIYTFLFLINTAVVYVNSTPTWDPGGIFTGISGTGGQMEK